MKLTKSELRQIIQEELTTMSEDTQKKVLTPSYIGPPPPKKVIPEPPWDGDEEANARYFSNPDIPNIEKKTYITANSQDYPAGGQEWMMANYPDDVESIGWKADRDAAAAAERAKHAKKVNESQDKLYQMVQEELEAVLDEKSAEAQSRGQEGRPTSSPSR